MKDKTIEQYLEEMKAETERYADEFNERYGRMWNDFLDGKSNIGFMRSWADKLKDESLSRISEQQEIFMEFIEKLKEENEK